MRSLAIQRTHRVGNAAVEPGGYSAYGTNAPGHPTIEGISIQGNEGLGFTVDYGSLEHAAVGLGQS